MKFVGLHLYFWAGSVLFLHEVLIIIFYRDVYTILHIGYNSQWKKKEKEKETTSQKVTICVTLVVSVNLTNLV